MLHLLVVSLIWAFSFGLIKGRLAGLDSAFISATRLGLALLVFLPFVRLRGIALRQGLALGAIGAVQFGLMYLAYNASFQHLQAHEVALFTLTTPLFVALIADGLERKLHPRSLLAALLAVAGGAVVTLRKDMPVAGTVTGILLVQLSNASFAVGQVLYRRLRLGGLNVPDREVFGLLYAGGFVVCLPVALLQSHVDPSALNTGQLATLLYLGVLASGVCFFVWNLGSLKVNAGTLAVFNNAKIPLAVACSLLVFGETARLDYLAISAALLVGAVWLARRG